MFIPYSNLQPSWLEASLAEVLHISRIALWRMVLVLVLAVGTAGIPGFRSVDQVSESRSRFIDAFGSLRVLEGRLVGFPYEPLPRQAPSSERIAEAARSFHRWAERRPSSEVAAEMALLRLMEGDWDPAITLLERISSQQNDARSLSDLASAYLYRGRVEDRPLDLLKALNASSRAVELDPDLPEARFNQALALEKLVLMNQSRAAWIEYARRDLESEWITEAEEHSRVLARDTDETEWKSRRVKVEQAALRGDSETVQHWIAYHRQRARLFAEETLLPAWADAWINGRKVEAARTLQVARSVGGALSLIEGDWMVHDAVAGIDKELAANKFDPVSRIALGHLRLAEGIRLHRVPKDQEARELLESAAFLLQESPFSLWARFHAGSCDFYEGDTAQLQKRLETLMLDMDRERYPNLAANVLSLKGMAEGRLAHLDKSLRAYRLALTLFQGTGESGSIAAIHFMIAENFRFQGDSESAWSYRLRALRLANDFGGTVYYHNSLLDGAESALRESFPELALRFHNEMILGALRRQDPLSLAETYLRRSRTQQRVGQAAAAAQDLESAQYWLAQVFPGERQRRLQADLDAAGGEIWLSQDPQQAVERLTSAIDLYLQHQDRFLLPDLYLARARAFLALDDLLHGELDLRAGITEIEAQRDGTTSPLLRAIYLHQSRATFDKMIRLQAVDLSRPEKAFEYAERYRAQDVRANEPGADPITSSRQLVHKISAGSALIQYKVLDDRLLVWVAMPGKFSSLSLGLGRYELEQIVEHLSATLGTPSEMDTLSLLYEQLVRPLEREISKADAIFLIPDESLHRVPFAALFDKRTQKFLVQDYVISYSPGATFLAHALQMGNGSRIYQAVSSALVVGNPSFDSAIFPKLKNLPSAEAEAVLISSLYQDGRLLIGPDATKESFLKELDAHDVVHFGGHAVVNLDMPLLSGLVLAPSRGDLDASAGALYSYEISALRLSRTRLLVLAGCQTAGGRILSGEGVASLASSFLSAGVGSVVGSLWRVDDSATSKLFVSFHASLRRGEPPAKALRNAQLSLLAGNDAKLQRPSRWAAFKSISAL